MATSFLMQTRSFSASAAEAVPVPSMGDSISEGTVVEWIKGKRTPASLSMRHGAHCLCLCSAPGDFVEADEVVVVLETDKVTDPSS